MGNGQGKCVLKQGEGLALQILETIPVGVTLTDADGRILYFNPYAASILDRKPEYIGRDIRFCHREEKSVQQIDQFLEAFAQGRKESFHYSAIRYGRRLAVTISPINQDGRFMGCLQTVVVSEEMA